MTRTIETNVAGVAATLRLGRAIGRLARAGDVIALYGELGAGKTVLTKGIAAGAGFRQSRNVTSPSFVLINEYPGRLTIYHVDAYRLKGLCSAASPDPACDLGWDELFYGDGICIVEWADRVADILPAERLDIVMEHEASAKKGTINFSKRRKSRMSPFSMRRIRLAPRGARYEALVEALRKKGYFSETDQ